jgi:hypothetical protein
MSTFQCPACSASLSEGSAMCSVCKTSIDWQGGQPVVTTASHALGRVAIYVLIALLAAGAVLAATLLIVSST